jgi:hypothetical protein
LRHRSSTCFGCISGPSSGGRMYKCGKWYVIYFWVDCYRVKVPRNRTEGPEEARDIAVLFLDLGTSRGGWSAPRPGHFNPRKELVPIVQEARWALGPVWTCAKNLAPTEIRFPDRPARSQSLYRLSYPGPRIELNLI